ncbi:hypothetical protein I7I49_29395 [Sinorhizobium meliloti]|uniref:hypothetical protein n=1 Tax=Rhizobium meliloti TaxID=382 RepID=UPI00237F8851|nr:hypothetical protein [Sinorhizobium meliloti]MDE3814292.1 hypothetical protein [Sinorhizobium meliloti]
MALPDLILELENAAVPDRRLDTAIALVVGYKRKVEHVTQTPGKEPVRQTLWIMPGGGEQPRVPYYTSSIDAAYELAQTIAPNNAGGCSYDGGRGRAKINDGQYCHAATPALALCVAALKEKMFQEGGRLD